MYNKDSINNIFRSVANKYDIMNTIMSFGLHKKWKSQFIKKVANFEDMKVIDVASGTGDISIGLAKRFREKSKIYACDPNKEMLDICKKRVIDNYIDTVSITLCDAEKLPFEDLYFNVYTISFGIRNVIDREAAISEAYRVLKNGGQFLCMEFGHVEKQCINKLYSMYRDKVIPNIGKIVAKDKEAYEYLANSITNFCTKDEFIYMLEQAGFSDIEVLDFQFGVVNIFVAWKITN